ncbi:hypothetical protein PENFLA_c027G07784 [Penicillium flavigenum]|uniref:Uncharacterized protein n=1 Tax=Penicillium flavigenum TaxID=254877 RepID=A0A1V6SRE8_9EURO|nr:hypothetical protein PENFLA_c027G07784 [Penicillium flavigenum]
MASKDRKYRLWSVPLDMSIPQKRQRPCWDQFGGYEVVRANYNVTNDWYCKHSYFCYPGAETYHCINVTGWYYSMNPDGSEEILHMKRKEAWFGPADSDIWQNWSNVVPWDNMPAIPDLCIERTSRPGPWIWSEIERLEREQVLAWSLLDCGMADTRKLELKDLSHNIKASCKNDDVLDHRCNNLDPKQPSEGEMLNVDEDVMSATASDISVKSEDNTSEDENEAAKYTSVKPTPSHRKVEEPEKEPEEHEEQKKQKKRKSEQAEDYDSARAKKMRTGEEEIERPDEQESQEKPEERKRRDHLPGSRNTAGGCGPNVLATEGLGKPLVWSRKMPAHAPSDACTWCASTTLDVDDP